MIVYRIETASGEGAWRAGLAPVYDYCKAVRARSCYDMPGPHDEISRDSETPLARHCVRSGYYFSNNEVFGFATLGQLRAAFGSRKGRKAMREAGGKLAVYDVPDQFVFAGTSQVIFKRLRGTKPVSYLNLETLR